MINFLLSSLLKFSKSSEGEVIIRIFCVFFIGGLGSNLFFKVFADLFELFATPRKKKIIEALAKVLGVLGCIALSILMSILYSKDRTDLRIYGEGILYGFGGLGLYFLFITGKLKKIITFFKNIRLNKK